MDSPVANVALVVHQLHRKCGILRTSGQYLSAAQPPVPKLETFESPSSLFHSFQIQFTEPPKPRIDINSTGKNPGIFDFAEFLARLNKSAMIRPRQDQLNA
jgi:hypothetical protein